MNCDVFSPPQKSHLALGAEQTDPADFWSYQNEPVSLWFSYELEQEGKFSQGFDVVYLMIQNTYQAGGRTFLDT